MTIKWKNNRRVQVANFMEACEVISKRFPTAVIEPDTRGYVVWADHRIVAVITINA